MPVKGHCQCGRINVTVDDAATPLKFIVCHCLNCSTTASSPFSLVTMAPKTQVKIEGEPKSYRDSQTKSGNTITRHFCPDCGSPVASESPAPDYAETMILKAGLFTHSLDTVDAPMMEIFTANREKRHPWLPAIPGVKQA